MSSAKRHTRAFSSVTPSPLPEGEFTWEDNENWEVVWGMISEHWVPSSQAFLLAGMAAWDILIL